MDFLLPFLSAGANDVGAVFDKLCLRQKQIGFRTLLLLEFFVIFVAIVIYVLIAHIPAPVFSLKLIGLLLAIILLSFAQNIFELKGIQAMSMNIREPISNLEPILTGVLAYFFFASEENIHYLIAIIIGALIVMWSTSGNFSLRHLFAAGSGYVFADISLSAILDNLIKFGLFFITPVFLPLIRTGGIFLLLLLFLRPSKEKRATFYGISLGIWSGIFFAIATVLRVYAIKNLGLDLTVLILLLEPGLMYLLSFILLKERFTWKPIIGSLAIGILILLVH